MNGGSGSGRTGGAALVLAAVASAFLLAPPLLLRNGAPWRDRSVPVAPAVAARDPGREDLDAALREAEAARAVAATVFRPDPSRRLAPPAARNGGPAAPARITGLEGNLDRGRIRIRWKAVPGAPGTRIRVEGLGGPEAVEREVAAPGESLDLPIPGVAGVLVIRATTAGGSGPAAETRISVPYRIEVEVLGAERPKDAPGSAFLRLRRAFDGRNVEAEFAHAVSDLVGGLSPVGDGGPIVEFRTDLVLEAVRCLWKEGPPVEVPRFQGDGRIERDEEGRPLYVSRPSRIRDGHEVVLRGPDEARRHLRIE